MAQPVRLWDTRRFLTLDGLRGIAALAVAIGHLYPGVFYNTTLAVDFFFMLSSFVLIHTYANRIGYNLSWLDFMRKRIIRLMPMTFLGNIVGALSTHSLSGIFGALLIPSFGLLMYPLDPPCWSLLFELIACGLLGVGLWQRSFTINFTIIVCSTTLLTIGIFHRGDIDVGWKFAGFHYGFLRVMYGFSIGSFVYFFKKSVNIYAYIIITVFLLDLLIPLHSALYQVLSLLIILPLILLAGANAKPFLGAEWLGDLSYPFYVVHFPVFAFSFIPRVLCIPISIIFSLFALKLYDEPLRRWLATVKISNN